MAQSLVTLRNNIITSIHGRRLGLDKDDFLMGKPIPNIVEDFTSTSSGTAASNHGITRAMASGSTQTANYSLASPTRGGLHKFLHQISTSTGVQIFTPAGGETIYSASGSSVAVVALLGAGAKAWLMSLSTAIWAMMSGSTIAQTNVQHTTST
jgi:hypothetical protein